MSIKLMIGPTDSGRTGQVHAASIVALHSAAKHGFIDVDPNA